MSAMENGVNVYDKGAGEAVVFLHGWGSEYSVFTPFLDHLSQCRRAVALDLPGFGKSSPPPSAWGVGDYADFVAAFLRGLGIDRAVLIGHSFGGRIAITLASRKDSAFAVPHLILTSAAGIKPTPTLETRARQCLYKAGRFVLSRARLRRWFPGALDAWRLRHASADYRAASPLMRDVLVKTVTEDLTPRLAAIAAPTLLIWGENDTATPLADGRTMERLIPDAGLAVLPGAGHYPFLDNPYAFRLILDSFLGLDGGE